MFVFGRGGAVGGIFPVALLLGSPATLVAAILYLGFAFVIALSWYLPEQISIVPHWLEDLIYPIDQTNLDVLRFAHFLALAILTVRFVPRTWPMLNSWILYPALLCN